jgi:predicted HicB family RNase H-like nuclease
LVQLNSNRMSVECKHFIRQHETTMGNDNYYKVQVRVPVSLENQLKAEAKKESRSVSNYVLHAVVEKMTNKKRVEDNATTL